MKSYRKRGECPDYFEAQLYYVSDNDLFLTVDWDAAAEDGDYVVVEYWEVGRLRVQAYTGQLYIGVANILSFYKLEHSEQWRDRRRVLFN